LCFLADYEAEARRSIPHSHFEWISEGAADEETLRANEGAWCSPGLELMPRGAVDVGTVDLSVELTAIGSTLSWPVLVAPTSYQKLAHPDGEVATATAAARCDTCFVASHAMSCTSEVSPTAALPTHHARNGGSTARGARYRTMSAVSDRGREGEREKRGREGERERGREGEGRRSCSYNPMLLTTS